MPFKNRCLPLRMLSKSFTKHFKGFGSGFTEPHAKPDADVA
jgi:hypothetical protein